MLLEIVPQRVIEEGKKLGSFRNISFWRLACVNDVPGTYIDACPKQGVGGLL